MNMTMAPVTTELKLIAGRKIYTSRNGSTIRWTTPERASKKIKDRQIFTAARFDQKLRDLSWVGHLDVVGIFRNDCGCPACTGRRFNKW